MQNKNKLKFGIMCDGSTFSAWEANCINKLLQTNYAEPALLIINNDAQSYRSKLKKMIDLKHFLFNLYNHALVNPTSKAHKKVDMRKTFKNVPQIKCKAIRKGKFSEYFSDGDLKKIREKNLDFILRFGFNIIRGEILKVPKYGVWSFHHGDEQKYRGSPPGFWEIYNNDNINGAILQRLTDKLDGGIILQKGYFNTINYSYGKSRDNVFFGAAEWPAKVCSNIINNSAEYLNSPPSNSNAQIYKRPTNSKMIIYIIKIIKNNFKKINNYLFKHENWNIGIVNAPINKFLDKNFKPNIKWLKVTKNNYFKADPFGIKTNSKINILFESYNYKKAKGSISLIEIENNEIKEIINKKFHMSYPYIIKYKNKVYCVPETSEANEIALYEIEISKNQFIKKATLIENTSAIDPTIFKYKGYWWLFATKSGKYPNTKLYIWYAKDFFGPWKEHTSNSVKADVRSSRPAGTPFIYKGKQYRPAQDCSSTYGGKIVINEIIKLTKNKFEEKVISVVNPDRSCNFKEGLHTISGIGDITLVDGKRTVFVPEFFMTRIKNIIKYIIKMDS